MQHSIHHQKQSLVETKVQSTKMVNYSELRKTLVK